MSTVKANNIEPASGGTVTITGAALTTPALGTPASGTLTNCTGLSASTGLSGTTLASGVVNASINAITPTGGTLAVTGKQTISGNLGLGVTPSAWGTGIQSMQIGNYTALTNSQGGYTWLSNNAFFDTSWKYLTTNRALYYAQDTADGGHKWFNAPSGTAGDAITYVQNMALDNISLRPGVDNSQTLGTSSLRWSVVYAGTGAINTSDAREKTEVSKLTSAEISAAKALAKEIGSFRFLNGRRTHIGMTVQRAIEIMQALGLDPFKYAFICHDTWEQETKVTPAVQAQAATPTVPAVYETREAREIVILDGKETEIVRTYLHEVSPAVPAKEAIEAQPERTEVIREAGDRYGFRYDQLMMFIMAGMVAQ